MTAADKPTLHQFPNGDWVILLPANWSAELRPEMAEVAL